MKRENTATSGNKPRRRSKRFSRGTLMGAGLLLLVGVIGLGGVLRHYEPDFYKPARVALVSARQQLEASYSHEQALVENLKIAHRDLQKAIESLQQAKVGPVDRQKIEALRMSLRALQDPDRLAKTTPQQLQESYRHIEDQLNGLIAKIESPSQ